MVLGRPLWASGDGLYGPLSFSADHLTIASLEDQAATQKYKLVGFHKPTNTRFGSLTIAICLPDGDRLAEKSVSGASLMT